MRTLSNAKFRRVGVLLAATALATLMMSSSVAAAGSGTLKIDVCHLDRTLGTYQIITVATKSAHPKLPKGDYLADTRLAGKLAFAVAWTETDGVAGFSGCDNLISALIDDNADLAPSAGDKVLLGTYPTSFTAPFGFTAFAAAEVSVASVEGCGTGGVGIIDGSGLVAGWGRSAGELFAWGDLTTDPSPNGTVILQDNVGGGAAVNFTDRIIANPDNTISKADEGNNPWLEISVDCNS